MCNSAQINGETLSCADFHDWISIVAHDINSYLTALSLGTKMVHLKCGTASREELAADMDRVHQTVEKVNDLMRQIMYSKQLLSETVVAQPQWIQPQRLVNECIQHFQLQAQAKQIDLLSVNNLHDEAIYTDPKLLAIVLTNLLSNAIKFAPCPSQVTIHTIDNEGWVCFGVEDEGPGLSADELQILFHDFRPMSAKPTGGESSTGLGLYIVNRFVNMLMGKVWAESAGAGQGAIFNVAVPRYFAE